jgi:hypothetical protein
MSPPLVITLCSLIFLFLFSLFLFVFIILRRVVLARRQSRFREVYRRIEKDILEAISLLQPDFSLRVARRHQHHPTALTKVLLDYGDLIAGEGREQLRLIFDHALKDRCLKALASRRTAKRLQSARLFIIFFDPAESSLLHGLLGDKPIIRLAVINALSQVPSLETFTYIFQAFETDTGSTVRSYFNIMFSLGSRIESLVKACLSKPLPVEKLGLLVELVGAVPLRSLGADIINLAGHADKEIRIKVARALGKLLLPESVGALITLASDEAWEVKAQAVKSLGKLQNRDTIEILARSLFSPHWYVRHNAAYSLAEMGEAGMKKLKEVASQHEDTYARDMSVMVMNELLLSAEAA